MLKEPVAGRVKTRLGRDIGMTNSAWWFRHTTRRLIRRLQDPHWSLVLAVSPDRDGLHSRAWPTYLPRIAQGTGDLGDRMGRIMRSMPEGPVVIIGADIPGIQPLHINRAFTALGTADYVFGPAPDGGYWLIGAKRTRALHPNLFSDVRWSTEHALADTVRSCGTDRVTYVDTLADVDTVADLNPKTEC